MAIGDQRECTRCGYQWISIRAERPRSCPSCKSRQWDLPYVEKYGHRCEVCGHNWEGTSPHPKRCPECTSTRWNERNEVPV